MALDENSSLKRLKHRAEEICEQVQQCWVPVLAHIARLLLMSTFIEDGLRMIHSRDDQRRVITRIWGVDDSLADMFVILNMVGQLLCCVLIYSRIKVPVACGLLYTIILAQIVTYALYSVPFFLMRNLAVMGAVTILLVESLPDTHSVITFNQHGNKAQSQSHNLEKRTIMQLLGRILLVFMFITLFTFDMTYMRIVECAVGIGLLILIIIGYQTRIASFLLALWLFTLNFYLNAFWYIPDTKNYKDTIKFEFFQTLSVTGGFLLMVTVGPGDLSVDKKMK